MPHGLKRFHESRRSHFVTFSCFRRQPNFNSPEVYDLFVHCLEQMRRRFEICVYGYVVMPEHVHLLISEPVRATERLVRVRFLDSSLRSMVPQVRGRSLAANLGSLADALHYLKLSFTKQLHSKPVLRVRSGRSVITIATCGMSANSWRSCVTCIATR